MVVVTVDHRIDNLCSPFWSFHSVFLYCSSLLLLRYNKFNQNLLIVKNQVTILHPKIENPMLNSDLIGLIDLDFGLIDSIDSIGTIDLTSSIGLIGLYFGLIDLFPMIDLNYKKLLKMHFLSWDPARVFFGLRGLLKGIFLYDVLKTAFI